MPVPVSVADFSAVVVVVVVTPALDIRATVNVDGAAAAPATCTYLKDPERVILPAQSTLRVTPNGFRFVVVVGSTAGLINRTPLGTVSIMR